MQRLSIIISAIFILLAQPAFAADGAVRSWIVSQKSGSVQVLRSGLQPAAVSTSTKLQGGDTIVTATDGRVVLTRAGDYIVVAPSSRLLIPQDEGSSGFTRLIQEVGTLLYNVRHTGVPHFRVDAPMLAAVVKGTSFTVIVGPDRNAVQVTDGVVEVIAADGGMSRLVQKSETVFINRGRPADLVEASSESAITPNAHENETVYKIGESSQALMTPIAVLTSGLAREVPPQLLINANLQIDESVGYASTLGSGSLAVSSSELTIASGLVQNTATELSGAVGNEVVAPVVTEVVAPVVVPVVTEIVAPVVVPVVTEVVAPVVTEVVAPVVVPVVTEVVAPVVVPVVTEVVAPVVTEVVAPVVVPVVTEVVAPVVVPVVTEVVAPVVVPVVTEVVAPVVVPVVTEVVAPVVVPVVTEVVAPVVVPVVTEVVAPVVTEVVAPVVVPVVTEVVAPVVVPVVTEVVAPVVVPVVTEVVAPVVVPVVTEVVSGSLR